MPKSPQNCPFSNRVILGLGRDTPMDTPVFDYFRLWLSLLDRHRHVLYPCKSCFKFANLTRPCGLPV
ncbi:hypothetical protein F383_12195 [Gossypium arboreum]|uniref:Uncharacterized protein n=1 Tax=Gossypium arboreum TaxID=29729 RepID=A0A0B0NHW0_GOSAR|nr:hypothetical protein F383_12195 [Gossypium arboreum]